MDPISIILLVVFGLVALLLTGLTLLQEEQGEGLGGIFGGGSNNQVGNRKGNILTKATSVLGVLFLGVCFVFALNYRTAPNADSIKANLPQEIISEPAKVESWWTNVVPTAAPVVDPAAVDGAAVDGATMEIKDLEAPVASPANP